MSKKPVKPCPTKRATPLSVQAKAFAVAADLAEGVGVTPPRIFFDGGRGLRGARFGRDSGGWLIKLQDARRWTSRMEYLLLHEFAHYWLELRGEDSWLHGDLFVRTLAELLQRRDRVYTRPIYEYKLVVDRLKHLPEYRYVRDALIVKDVKPR